MGTASQTWLCWQSFVPCFLLDNSSFLVRRDHWSQEEQMDETCAGTLALAVMTEVFQMFLMIPLIPLEGFYLEDLFFWGMRGKINLTFMLCSHLSWHKYRSASNSAFVALYRKARHSSVPSVEVWTAVCHSSVSCSCPAVLNGECGLELYTSELTWIQSMLKCRSCFLFHILLPLLPVHALSRPECMKQLDQ